MTLDKPKEKPTSLTIKTTLTLGRPQAFRERELSNVKFLIGLITTNAPCFEFVRLQDIRVANISILCDEENNDVAEWKDAYAHVAGTEIPEMEMQARVLSSGFYTGLVPEGLAEGAKFDFIVTLSVRPPVDPMAITQPAPDGTIGKEILATPEDTGIQDKK